jgi:hypothetical protein
MTTKTAFNAEEWQVLANAPYLTGTLMIAASRGGTVRETVAISGAYENARAHYKDELLRQILSTPPALDPATAPRTPDDFRQAVPDLLRRAVSILRRTATEAEVNNYKRFVYYVAETVAHAHREGGFLGIGGKEVSEPEQAVLDEIAAILDEPHGGPAPGAPSPNAS